MDATARGATRGLVVDAAGFPVDATAWLLKQVGLGSERPVGGSRWIADQLRGAGYESDPDRLHLSDSERTLFDIARIAGASVPAGAGTLRGGIRAAGKAAEGIERLVLRPRSMREMEQRAHAFRTLGKEQVNDRLIPRDIERAVPESGTVIFARQGDVIDKEVLSRGFPKGFADAEAFTKAADGFSQAVPPRFGAATVGVRGSALHGRSIKEMVMPEGGKITMHTGRPFDAGRKSDIDFFIVNKPLYDYVERRGRQLGVDPTTLDVIALERLDLSNLSKRLADFGRSSGRSKTTLKLFPDMDSVVRRGSYLIRDR